MRFFCFMRGRRFGSASFLFLTAVLGMAGSAAASAVGNKEKTVKKANQPVLESEDLVGLQKKLVGTKVKIEKLLKLIALALGITTGSVAIGGTVYYFKDAEHRQKFLQAISERFHKDKASVEKIDEAVEEVIKKTEEIKENSDQAEKDKAGSSEKERGGMPSSEELNMSGKEENQETIDDAKVLAGKASGGNAFSDFVHSMYDYRNAMMGLSSLGRDTEESLNFFAKYVLFLGKDAFGNETLFAVFKIVHALLVVLRFVLFGYIYILEYKINQYAIGKRRKYKKSLIGLSEQDSIVSPLMLLKFIVANISDIVVPAVNVPNLPHNLLCIRGLRSDLRKAQDDVGGDSK